MSGSYIVFRGARRFCVTCAALAMLVVVWSSAATGAGVNPRIIDGQETRSTDWEFMAALRHYERDPNGFLVADISVGEGSIQQIESRAFAGSRSSPLVQGKLADCGDGAASCPEASGHICLVESRSRLTPEKQAENCWKGGGVGAIVLPDGYGRVYHRSRRIRRSVIPVFFVGNGEGALALRNQVGGKARIRARIDLFSFCGGAYLGSGWVVTAAHCVTGPRGRAKIDARELAVDLGGGDLAAQGRQVFGVERILVHQGYRVRRPFSIENDIALIKLDTVPQSATQVRIADSALLNRLAQSGASAVALGRGVTKRLPENMDDIDASWLTTRLYKTTLALSSREDCNERFNAYRDAAGDDTLARDPVGESMMCAGTLDGSTGTCLGDSGGPLLVRDRSGYALAGLTSWGISCAYPGVDDVFTHVPFFRDEIESAIRVGRSRSMAQLMLYVVSRFR